MKSRESLKEVSLMNGKQTRVIDLTYSIEEGMLTFAAPWHPKVSIKQLGSIGVEGRETRALHFGTHTGTHMDAPLHFVQRGSSIDQIQLDKLIGEVVIIDFSFLRENEAVTGEMLREVQIAKRMIFRFGWGKHWGNTRFYTGYPFFTIDAADYLISKGVELIGMDTPSPDDSRIKLGSAEDSQIHKEFLNAGVILLEYLANLDGVDNNEGWSIIVMPLKLKGADGSPVRACLYKEV